MRSQAAKSFWFIQAMSFAGLFASGIISTATDKSVLIFAILGTVLIGTAIWAIVYIAIRTAQKLQRDQTLKSN